MYKSCKTLIALVFFLALVTLLSATLPPQFTPKGNPLLYKQLHTKALDNLVNLDPATAKPYRKLLKQHKDLLMCFLIGYEADSNLLLARPQDIFSNYTQIKDLLQQKGCAYSAEFFLSYIARQTVSDERIQAYRAAFLDDGLRDIMLSAPNDMELYRAVSHWCVARLVFQPTSGRDQSPLDISTRSLLGRCEEMQILFVAAARTVGLPARPASTPWWAHADNNHAWAEVWLDGAWHYTGDMDAAYYPDQTWFSGMIDKTVLILADGTIPDERDEVLSTGKYDVMINSTRNYAADRTRTLKLFCTDPVGNPLAEVTVGIMVYNWNSLRPLAYVSTDANGYLQLSVGRGAFYLLALKDSLQALHCVPSGESSEVDVVLPLSTDDFASQDLSLRYPSNPFEWKQAPPIWNDGVKQAKQSWASRDLVYKQRAQAVQTTLADSLYWLVAAGCRENYLEFKLFADRNAPLAEDFMSFLLADDPKFLWQADSAQFEALYNFYQSIPTASFAEEDLRLLISPSVLYEELPRPFRRKDKSFYLYPEAFSHRGDSDSERLENALQWLAATYTIEPAKALSGQLPLQVAYEYNYLNGFQYRMLAVNLARANGIPADFTRMPNVISVLIDGDWQYWDLLLCRQWNPSRQDDDRTFQLDLAFFAEQDLPYDVDPSLMSVSSFRDGMFHTLNYQAERVYKGLYRYTLPVGKYYWQMGFRASDSETLFQLESVDGSSGEPVSLRFTNRHLPSVWLPASDDILALLQGLDLQGKDIILIGNYDRENSIRTAEKISAAGKSFLWLGYDSPRDPLAGYLLLPAWKVIVEKDQRHSTRTITLFRSGDEWLLYEGIWDKLP